MSILKVTNIDTGYGKKQVLYDVSLEVQKGESLLIVGSNGSGKSTLLKVIYGLLDVWQGKVEFEGFLLHDKNKKADTHKLLDKGIMYVPQKDALFDDMSVEENIQSSLLHLKDSREIKKRTNQVLDEMTDLQKRKGQLAGKLSGGERKLLSLAMVSANRPRLLLYDEPLAGVSEENVPMVMHWLKEVQKEDCTMVIVEHRVRELMDFADNIIGLKLGHLYTEKLKTLDNIKKNMV